MGDRDFIKPLLERHGKVYFGKVKMKPGKPLTFATIELDSPRSLIPTCVACVCTSISCSLLCPVSRNPCCAHVVPFVTACGPTPCLHACIEGKDHGSARSDSINGHCLTVLHVRLQ